MAVTQLRVTGRAADGNRYVLRVSIDLDLEALAVRDATAGSVRDDGTATTRIRKDDAGQVAESMRHRNRNLADRNIRARASAGSAELRRYRRQIPADGLALTLPGQDVPALLQAGAGTGVTLSFPAQLAPDLIGASRSSVRWKQSEERHLVLVWHVTGLSHISSLGFLILPVPQLLSSTRRSQYSPSMDGTEPNAAAKCSASGISVFITG